MPTLIDAADQRRACVKIGELSRELDKAPTRTKISGERPPAISKRDTLKAAGIAQRTANDYEQLAGGPEVNGKKAAAAAAEQRVPAVRDLNEALTAHKIVRG